MSIPKSLYRNLVAPVVVSVGAERLLNRLSDHQHLILCYHGVSGTRNTLNNRHLLFSQFEKHLVYLKKHFNVVPLNAMFSNPSVSRNKKKNIAITFDDGYRNNLTVALPILEKHQLPATFFIATEGLEERNYLMWPDIFDLLKFDKTHREYEFNGRTFVKLHGAVVCRSTGESITDAVKKMGRERDDLIRAFRLTYAIDALLVNVPEEIYSFMNKSDLVRFASSSYVDIGSHTHKHYNLANVDAPLADEELRRSKAILESILQKPVVSIAYPDGSYNDNVKNLADKAGYLYQLAVSYKNESDPKDQRILPRHGVSNTTTYEANMIQFNRQFAVSGF